jgi:hypothetical protein
MKSYLKQLLSLRLVQYRRVWCPTWWGLFFIVALLTSAMAWWLTSGESFLSLTRRLPPEVLVVEGWIGRDGILAAGREFKQRGYEYVVPTGGLTSERWDENRYSYAEMAQRELIRSGVPAEKIIAAPASSEGTQRTFGSAVAVWRVLQARGIHPKTLNVFTWGPHARRSRLVFAKVYQSKANVGVVSWTPPNSEIGAWWQSSDRAKELLTETASYVYEVIFNCGRSSNSPDENAFPGLSGTSALGTKIARP